jgi:hypothetical protein
MQETEIKISDDELIARITDSESVYMFTSVLRKHEAIALANKILEVMS